MGGWLLKFPKIISTYRTKIALDKKPSSQESHGRSTEKS